MKTFLLIFATAAVMAGQPGAWEIVAGPQPSHWRAVQPARVTGHPYSATATSRTLRTLPQGRAVIGNSWKIWRDAAGRVREESVDGKTVQIYDAPPPLPQPNGWVRYAPNLDRTAEQVITDLGTQLLNGVLAKGTRIATTIPAGAIGNQSTATAVTERWESPELQIVIKSTSTDPRFGNTTYELTRIVQAPPDPALFQVQEKE